MAFTLLPVDFMKAPTNGVPISQNISLKDITTPTIIVIGKNNTRNKHIAP